MSKREILMMALAATPIDLERLVRSLPTTVVAHKPTPNQWSIADVLCHFYMVEERYLGRLKLVIEKEERSFLAHIHPDEATHDLTLPLQAMLTDFALAREQTLNFLRGLRAGDWQCTAVHETWGDVKFRTLVQQLVDHDTNHLNQIISIRSEIK